MKSDRPPPWDRFDRFPVLVSVYRCVRNLHKTVEAKYPQSLVLSDTMQPPQMFLESIRPEQRICPREPAKSFLEHLSTYFYWSTSNVDLLCSAETKPCEWGVVSRLSVSLRRVVAGRELKWWGFVVNGCLAKNRRRLKWHWLRRRTVPVQFMTTTVVLFPPSALSELEKVSSILLCEE